MTETDDMNTLVQALEEAQDLIRARAELQTDANETIASICAALVSLEVDQALERTRLRVLSKSLVE